MKNRGELFELWGTDVTEAENSALPATRLANETRFMALMLAAFRDLKDEKVKLKRVVQNILNDSKSCHLTDESFLAAIWAKVQDAINFRKV
jgi:hypothetical protein